MGTLHPFPSRALVFTNAELEQALACALPRVEALREMAEAMVQTCPPGDSRWAEVMDQRDALTSFMQKVHNALAEQNNAIPLCKP